MATNQQMRKSKATPLISHFGGLDASLKDDEAALYLLPSSAGGSVAFSLAPEPPAPSFAPSPVSEASRHPSPAKYHHLKIKYFRKLDLIPVLCKPKSNVSPKILSSSASSQTSASSPDSSPPLSSRSPQLIRDHFVSPLQPSEPIYIPYNNEHQYQKRMSQMSVQSSVLPPSMSLPPSHSENSMDDSDSSSSRSSKSSGYDADTSDSDNESSRCSSIQEEFLPFGDMEL